MFFLFVFWYLLSSRIAPCVRTAGRVQTPTLDAVLLSSSRAGADLGQIVSTIMYLCTMHEVSISPTLKSLLFQRRQFRLNGLENVT